MSLTYSGAEPQPALAWQFENSNVDSVTGVSPSNSTFVPTSIQVAPTYVSGKYGKGIYFNNQNSISLSGGAANSFVWYSGSNFVNFNSNNFTICFWVNPYFSIPAPTGNQIWVNIADSQCTYQFGLNTNASTTRPFLYINASPSPNLINPTSPLVTGTWSHQCATFSNVGMTGSNTYVNYYFNGALQASSNVGKSGTSTFVSGLQIGSILGNGSGAWVSIDDLRIYNTALTATQVASVYSSQGAPAPSLAMPLPKLAWSFDGTTTDYVSGLSAITPTQLSGYSSFMITTAPTSNTAAYFPGNASQMLTAAGPLNNLNLTTTNVFAESLVYMNSIIASPSIILSKGKKTDPADWWFGINNTGTFQATVTNTGGTPFTASTSTNLATGSWNHVAFSYVASTKVIYVWLNGANQGSATLTGTANNYSSFFTYMAWDGGSQYANMYVRDIRVVSGGVVPTSTTFAPTVAPWGLAQAAYVTGMGTSIYAFPSQTINYTPGIYGQAIVLTNPLNQTAHPNNYVTWTLSPSLGSTTTAYGYTVSFWFKPTSTAGSQQMVDIAGFNGDGDWRFFLDNSNLQFFYLINNSASTTTYNGITSTVNYTVNGWNHAAVSLYESATGTSICLYLNNILQGTLTSQWGSLRTFSKLGIGNYPSGQTYPFGYNGSVDDLRVYNTALTSTQVQSIYNQQGVPGRGVVNGITPNITQTPVATIYGNQITPADTSTSKPTTSVSGQTTYSNTSSHYTQFGSGLALTPATTGLTISIVLTFNNGVFTTENLFYLGGNGNYQISVRVATYDALALQIWDSVNSRFISYNPPFTPIASWSAGVKYYFTFTITPVSTTTVNCSVYVNGAVNGSGSGTSTATALGNGTYTTATIGANNNGAYANMTVYDFFVLNTVLSDSQVSTLYQKQLANSNYQIAPPAALTGTPLFSQLSPAATSSAVGAFSLRAVNGVSVKAVNVRPVAQFPPAAMTGATTSLTGYPFGGTGSYVASSSSIASGTYVAWQAFDKSNALDPNEWASSSVYSGTTYGGSTTTTVSSTSYPGEWLQIQFPSSVLPTSITITSPWNVGGPRTFVFAGSVNGSTWDLLINQTTATNLNTNNTSQSFPISTTNTYNYFRLIVTTAYQIYAQVGELVIFGSGSAQDFYADRLGNLLTAPVVGQSLANWLGGATGYVTTWYDQSGKGNHATQATAANQPVIQRATKGAGYSCLFNGTTNYMNFGSSTILNGTNYSVCASTRRNVSGGGRYYIGSNGAGSTRQNLSVGYFDDTDIILNEGAYATGTTVPAYSAGSEPTGYDFVMLSQTTGAYCFCWRNGTSYPGGNNGVNLPLNSAGVGIIGAVATNGSYGGYFSGEMFEILVLTTSSLFDLSGSSSGQLTPIPSVITQIYQNQLSAYGT